MPLKRPLSAPSYPWDSTAHSAADAPSRTWGRRPCLPDMVPVIGKGERHQGLWFAFGHAHHGFTLGPATGRLLAEMMTGKEPFTDPSCYAASRFAAN